MMLVSQILEDYYKKYPIYKSIKFSVDSKCESENIHPLLILSQYIIDKLLSEGNNRVAIVLPDDECNVIPLIIAKYFSNIQNELDYAGNVLEDIDVGQHLRLGKAVVEFGGIIDTEEEKRRLRIKDERKYIKLITGRKDQTTVYCPLNGVHYLFEKTEGALSLFAKWREARAEAESKLENTNSIITTLGVKRTTVRKTIALLSPKNDFKEFIETLYVNGQELENTITCGEIDLDSPSGFKLYNKGKLDCLPSISIMSKIEELYYLLKKDKSIEKQIFAIFSTIEKFDEIVNNPDTFKRILKYDIPFITFVSESEFENFPLLTDYGFELWHWKPSTMKSDALLVGEDKINVLNKKNIYGRFAERVNMAALSDFKLEIANNKKLRNLLRLISSLSTNLRDADNVLHQFVRRTWKFFNVLSTLICPIIGNVKEKLEMEFNEIREIWNTQKHFYSGQTIEKNVDEIFLNFTALLSEEKTAKLLQIEQFIFSINLQHKSVLVLLPDKYQFFKETFKYLSAIKGDGNIRFEYLQNFYSKIEKAYGKVDCLLVSWFDKDEYVHIKQSYCYENLCFVVYDFENKWRERYVMKIDECIPHDNIKHIAEKIDFSQEDIFDKPLDRVFVEGTKELDDISDYNISNTIIRSTFNHAGIDENLAEAIECVPIVLSNEKIAYFYPTHDVIDVTALARGDSDRPIKKNAVKLKKGDKILIRQSDKDIIKEKADILMAQNGESNLRSETEIWNTLLGIYANNRPIANVCKALNSEGGECTFQQVRYWLSGETIMPREKDILVAIGMVASNIPELKELSEKYLNLIDSIYIAGQKVRSYHQRAGRWLTGELKNKALEIKTIANKHTPQDEVDGIGEIYVYTVEDVLSQEITIRGKINKIEDLY